MSSVETVLADIRLRAEAATALDRSLVQLADTLEAAGRLGLPEMLQAAETVRALDAADILTLPENLPVLLLHNLASKLERVERLLREVNG